METFLRCVYQYCYTKAQLLCLWSLKFPFIGSSGNTSPVFLPNEKHSKYGNVVVPGKHI